MMTAVCLLASARECFVAFTVPTGGREATKGVLENDGTVQFCVAFCELMRVNSGSQRFSSHNVAFNWTGGKFASYG